MAVTRQRRKVLGRKEDNTCVMIGKGRIIPSDPKRIAAINTELRKKCEEQRKNDAEAAISARKMWAGPEFEVYGRLQHYSLSTEKENVKKKVLK